MTQLSSKLWSGLFPQAEHPVRLTACSFSDLKQLTKPRITMMVAVTTLIGYVMALRFEQPGMLTISQAIMLNWPILVLTLLGTALSCMGASAINQVIERRFDALMPRTQLRPLPTGRMHPAMASIIGITLSTIGFVLLFTCVGIFPALLAGFTVLSYSFIYTPMKRWSSFSTIVGAVPGALPPVIGATAATGHINISAILLFAIMFLWQLPHFLAIAWLYRKDYHLAGMKVLPVVEPDGRSTFRQIIVGCLALLPLGLLPTLFGVSGLVYFVGALLTGLAFLASGFLFAIYQTRQYARLVFFVSLIYLPMIYILMLVDQV